MALSRQKKVDHHELKLYPDDAALVDDFAQFLEAALNTGNAVVVVATELLRDSILQKLRAGGIDLRTAAEAKRYLALDDADPLSIFTIDEAVKAAKREGLHIAVG
jgi:hypothetical protein